MQDLPAWHCSTTKPEGGLQLRQGFGPCLLVRRLLSKESLQLVRKHGANAGFALSGKRACSFQELLVDRQGNVPLHGSQSLAYT
jgi:hypothetical protein